MAQSGCRLKAIIPAEIGAVKWPCLSEQYLVLTINGTVRHLKHDHLLEARVEGVLFLRAKLYEDSSLDHVAISIHGLHLTGACSNSVIRGRLRHHGKPLEELIIS